MTDAPLSIFLAVIQDDNDEVYDMVSDDEYQRIVKKRLEKDDFIEDDGTEGYADDGREEWGGDRGMDEEERRERRGEYFLVPCELCLNRRHRMTRRVVATRKGGL